MGGESIAASPQYEADWGDELDMHGPPEQQSSFAEQLRKALNTIPAYTWYADPLANPYSTIVFGVASPRDRCFSGSLVFDKEVSCATAATDRSNEKATRLIAARLIALRFTSMMVSFLASRFENIELCAPVSCKSNSHAKGSV